MKFIQSIMILLAIVSVTGGVAYAHVVNTDASTGAGAVVHVSPNDDPAAGEASSVVFAMGNDIDLGQYELTVFIRGEEGSLLALRPDVKDQSVSVMHTFEDVGTYSVVLDGRALNETNDDFTIEHSQVVSRTINIDENESANGVWFVAVLSAVVLGGLLYGSVGALRLKS